MKQIRLTVSIILWLGFAASASVAGGGSPHAANAPISLSEVPEPGTVALIGGGLIALGLLRRRLGR
jgi:hypothetical protein